MRALQMQHDVDPRGALLALFDLTGVEVFANQILIATYQRPEKLASGLIVTDKTRDEDKYQGKVSLVLKKGPQAFVDDAKVKFLGQNVEVGDWIVTHSSAGMKMLIGEHQVQIITDQDVKLRVPHPDFVF